MIDISRMFIITVGIPCTVPIADRIVFADSPATPIHPLRGRVMTSSPWSVGDAEAATSNSLSVFGGRR